MAKSARLSRSGDTLAALAFLEKELIQQRRDLEQDLTHEETIKVRAKIVLLTELIEAFTPDQT
jgi:hypothetical protein